MTTRPAKYMILFLVRIFLPLFPNLNLLYSSVLDSNVIHFSREGMKRRRQCRIYSKSDLLTAFENANTRIISKYTHSSRNLTDEGIDLLRKLTAQFLRKQSNPLPEFPTFQALATLAQAHRPQLLSEVRPGGISYAENERITFSKSQEEGQGETCKFAVEMSEKKPVFHTAVANREVDSTTKKLSKSFKKMGLDERFCEQEQHEQEQEQEDGEESTHNQLPSYNGMSIIQILEESNRKVEQRILEREGRDSDSSYPLTDYSSNNSSNDNDYQEQFRESANSNSYKPSNILCSPMKSKSQAKEKRRLYVRQKKIPQWAADLEAVSQVVIAQQRQIDPDAIYGTCVVEHLNTNIIFNSDVKYYRGSSAKWNRNLLNQFVT